MSLLYNDLWVTFIYFHFSLMPAYLRHRLQGFFSGLLLKLLFFLFFFGELFHLLLLLFCSPLAISITTSNLSFIVSAPAVNKAVLCSGDGVVLSTSNLNDIISFKRIEIFDSGWNSCIKFRAYSQLSPIIQSPRE